MIVCGKSYQLGHMTCLWYFHLCNQLKGTWPVFSNGRWRLMNSGSCLFVSLPRSQILDQETKLGIWQLSVPAESDLVLMNISHISYRSSTGSAQYHRGWLEYFFSYKSALPLWNSSIHSACRACQAPQRRPQCWRHRDDCYHLVNFWELSGHSMHVRYAPSFLRLVGTPFKRVPVDCNSLRQFTLCMPSFWTQVTLSPSRQFRGQFNLNHHFYTGSIIPTPDGYACTCEVNRYLYLFFWFLSVDVMQVQELPDSWISIKLC